MLSFFLIEAKRCRREISFKRINVMSLPKSYDKTANSKPLFHIIKVWYKICCILDRRERNGFLEPIITCFYDGVYRLFFIISYILRAISYIRACSFLQIEARGITLPQKPIE